MFDPEFLITHFGLLAVYATAALEGDAAVIAAGVLHQRGFFPFWPTVAVAALGGWTSDLLIYGLARRYRDHPRTQGAVVAAQKWRLFKSFVAYPMLLALAIRFLPGVRTIGPVSLATATPLSPLRYVVLTAIAAMVWAVTLVMVGKGAGHALQRIFRHLDLPDGIGVALVVAAVVVLSIFAVRKLRRRAKAPERA